MSHLAAMGKAEGTMGRRSNGDPCQTLPTPAPHQTSAVGHSRVMVCIIDDNCKTEKKLFDKNKTN
jgi:hypothetical protein